MAKVEIDLDSRQIERLVSQLDPQVQRQLAQRVAAQQADRVLQKVRRRVRALGLTQRDIARIVAEVRQGRYARSGR